MLWYFLNNQMTTNMLKPGAKVTKRFAGGHLPLIALSPGGVAEGDSSQGLESFAWACWVDGGGKIRLDRVGDRAVNPEANVVSFLESVSGSSFSKLSLAFDQNARRVVAWTENHNITVSRVANTLVEERETWAGEDCLLFWDGLLLDAVTQATDVTAFYLSLDRLNLKYRLQSENYAVEHHYQTLPEPCSLDCVARSSVRIAFYLTPKNKNSYFSVVSDLYPVREKENFSLIAGLFGGFLTDVVVKPDSTLETLSFASTMRPGAYTLLVVSPDSTLETFGLTSALQSGVYALVVVSPDSTLEPLSFAWTMQPGVYAEVIVTRDTVAENFNFSTSLVGGIYA